MVKDADQGLPKHKEAQPGNGCWAGDGQSEAWLEAEDCAHDEHYCCPESCNHGQEED